MPFMLNNLIKATIYGPHLESKFLIKKKFDAFMSFTSIYVHSTVASHEVDAPLLYTLLQCPPSPPLEGRLRPLLCHSWFS